LFTLHPPNQKINLGDGEKTFEAFQRQRKPPSYLTVSEMGRGRARKKLFFGGFSKK
jgi:hypothetical protein